MAKLGDRVVFVAPPLHHTETVKDGVLIAGSIYCVDQYEFAAIVGRVYEAPVDNDSGATEEEESAGRQTPHPSKAVQVADLFLLVPGKVGQWLKGLREGNQPGEFHVVK